SDPPPGTISPAVSGKWTWDGPRTLNFTPDAPLPKATAVTVTLLPDRLRTPDGFRLKGPQVTSVHTQPLHVLGVRQAAFDERDRLVVEIQFNDDVLPADAIAHLSLRDVNGRPISFHPHGDAIGHVIRVLTDPIARPAAEEHHPHILVQVSPGLAGRSGPLGLTQEYQSSLPVEAALAATGARVDPQGDGPPVIRLSFNNPIDRDAVAPLLSVDPKIDFSLTRGNEDSTLELHGDFAPATRYAIRIAPAKGAAKDRNAPRPDTLSVFVPDRAPSVRFEHPEGYLGSAGNRTVLAHATNITHLRVTVTRIYDNNLVVWRHTRADPSLLDQPIATRDLKLATIRNKKQDVRLSLDELLPAGAPRDGVYMLRLEVPPGSQTVSENGGGDWPIWQDSALVTLSDIGLTAKRGRTMVTVWATSLRTAQPLPGVRVRLYSSKNQRLGESMTDSDGLARLPILALPEGEAPSVILADRPESSPNAVAREASASTARDLTWLDLGTSRIGVGETDTAGDTYLRNGHEAFVYTDRGVYRPGETVHFRAIVRGPDGATPPSFPVCWQFRRPDLHDWKSITGQLDADGAVSLDLPLPDDLPTGRWSVSVRLPGTHKEADAFGSTSFQVEDFMPSRMQVGLTLKGTHSSGSDDAPRFLMSEQPLSAVVQADYLFGKPVSERPARIVARIDPTTFAPSGWRDWTFGDSAAASQTLDNLKVTGHRLELPEQALDAKGHAAFDVDLDALLAGDNTSPAPTTPKRRKRGRKGATTLEPPAQQTTAQYTGAWRLVVSASVIEQGGRAVTATSGAELDTIPAYIGVRAKSANASAGGPTSFDVALVAPNGQPFAKDTDLDAAVYRETWNNSLAYEKGRYVYHSTRLLEPVQKKIAVKISAGKGTLDLMPDGYGSYVLCLRDARTGAMTSLAFYSGQGAWEDNISRENPEKLQLIVRPLPHVAGLMRAISNFDEPAAIGALKDLLHPQTATPGKLHPGDV
ncbi:MAG TPA: MG2 domain-containing protein, partial [Tepidisphaeraceae bacterium]|nr:MG2 domain-containing protein [Tepidisphaeraceae bacterium]